MAREAAFSPFFCIFAVFIFINHEAARLREHCKWTDTLWTSVLTLHLDSRDERF